MLLTIADLVLQAPPARAVIHRTLLSKGYTHESAFQLWHSCLRWWSFRVPLGYLAIAALAWINLTLVPGFWPFSLLFAVALIMALASALRLLPLRDEIFEESDWNRSQT